ncbi:MAG: hypothetical protein AB8G95_29675 [Anaerolineae bacterium]
MLKKLILILTVLGLGIIGCMMTAEPEPTNEFVGVWHEVGRIDCETGEMVEVPRRVYIDELKFEPDHFFLTWLKFEDEYHDYWGTYEIETETGRISMTREYGNRRPPDMDLEGTIYLNDHGQLVLEEVWFGSQSPIPNWQAFKPCAFVFTRS